MKHWLGLIRKTFSFTEIKQLEKQNEITNENNSSWYNHRSIDNVSHCNNPTIALDKLPNICNHIVYHN